MFDAYAADTSISDASQEMRRTVSVLVQAALVEALT